MEINEMVGHTLWSWDILDALGAAGAREHDREEWVEMGQKCRLRKYFDVGKSVIMVTFLTDHEGLVEEL